MVLSRVLNGFLYKRSTSVPPIIIVGMHSSGTRLLVRLLENGGVFMGSGLTPSAESTFFQNINIQALDLLGCSWRCTRYLPDTSNMHQHYEWVPSSISNRVKAQLVSGHWGQNRFSLLWHYGVLWGWKDPRNSLLLPVWQRVFPNALVINIYRDGRDVAISLLDREIKRDGEYLFSDLKKRELFVDYLRLWEFYVRRIQEALPLFERHYTIKYEELLTVPEIIVRQLCQQVSIPVHSSLQDAVSLIDPSRMKRYEKPEYAWTQELVGDSILLKELGYIA